MSRPLALALLLLSPARPQTLDRLPALTDFDPARQLRLRGDLKHVQGVDTDGRRMWVTSVDAKARQGRLFEFRASDGKFLRSVELQEGDRFHAGGLSGDRESLWIPVAEYRASSSSVVQRRSKRTLELEFEFPVPDHIGCLAVSADLVIGGNWDSREFYVWNRKGELLRKVTNTTGNAYQDMKFVSGSLIASGLLLENRTGAIDVLDFPSLELRARMAAGKTPRQVSLTREGMAIFRGDLLLLPEDGPDSTLFTFRGAGRWLVQSQPHRY